MGPRTHLYERLVGEPELDGPAARDAMCTRSAGGAGRGRHRALKTGGGWGWGGTPFSDPLSAQQEAKPPSAMAEAGHPLGG